MAGRKARRVWMTPHRLTSSTRRQSSTVVSRKEPLTPMPALAITRSGTPCSAPIVRGELARWRPRRRRRAGRRRRRPRLAVRSAASRSMSRQRTSAPAPASARAVSRPMPLPAPVTTARWPAISVRGVPSRARVSSRGAGRPSTWSTNSVISRATASGWVRGAQCPAASSRRQRPVAPGLGGVEQGAGDVGVLGERDLLDGQRDLLGRAWWASSCWPGRAGSRCARPGSGRGVACAVVGAARSARG